MITATDCYLEGCKCYVEKEECGVEVVRKKEWVGLTYEEKIKLRYLVDWTVPLDIKKFADSVEAKLKEKNT